MSDKQNFYMELRALLHDNKTYTEAEVVQRVLTLLLNLLSESRGNNPDTDIQYRLIDALQQYDNLTSGSEDAFCEIVQNIAIAIGTMRVRHGFDTSLLARCMQSNNRSLQS